jgi:hypothetical protein
MIGNGMPTFIHDFAEVAQEHFFVDDFTKQTIAVICHNRNVICTRL